MASSCSYVEVGPCFSLHAGPLEAMNSLPGALSHPRHRARDPNTAFEVKMNYERRRQCRRELLGALKGPQAEDTDLGQSSSFSIRNCSPSYCPCNLRTLTILAGAWAPPSPILSHRVWQRVQDRPHGSSALFISSFCLHPLTPHLSLGTSLFPMMSSHSPRYPSQTPRYQSQLLI